jgi:hypothetical protein
MMHLQDWSAGNRVALGIATVAVIAVGTRLPAMRRSASDGDVAITEQVRLPAVPAVLGPSGDSLARVIDGAVSADPFHPRRTRPAVRFRARGTPGDAAPVDSAAAAVASAANQPAAAMRLQGIAHLANGGALAVLSVGGGTAQLLRVGQSIDQYHLIRVDSSSATLVGGDSTITLHLRDVSGTSKP